MYTFSLPFLSVTKPKCFCLVNNECLDALVAREAEMQSFPSAFLEWTSFFSVLFLYLSKLCVCVWVAGSSVCPQAEAVAHWLARCPLTSSTLTTMACSRWSNTWGSHSRDTSKSMGIVCVYVAPVSHCMCVLLYLCIFVYVCVCRCVCQ